MEQAKMYLVEKRKFDSQVTRPPNKWTNNIPNRRANKNALASSAQRPNNQSAVRLDHPLHRRRKAADTGHSSVSSCLNQFVSQFRSSAGNRDCISRFTNHPRNERFRTSDGQRRVRSTSEPTREPTRKRPRSEDHSDAHSSDHHRSKDRSAEFISQAQSISHEVELNVENVNKARDPDGQHPIKLTGAQDNGKIRRERVSSLIRRSQHIEAGGREAAEIKRATKSGKPTKTLPQTTGHREEDSENVENGLRTVQRTVQDDANLLYSSRQKHNSYLIKFLCKSSAPINCGRNSTLWRFLLLFAFFATINGAPRVVKIGALFTDDHKDGPSELAFKYAVYRINKDRTILPNTTLIYDIQYTPREDSFHAAKRACLQISNGVSAIFGPQDTLLGNHIQSLCDALEIPHLEARLDLEPQVKEVSINLYPNARLIGQAIRELINYLNWTSVAVIYEDDISLIKLQSLVNPPMKKSVQFTFRKTSVDQFRDVLMDIRTRGLYSMIIDLKNENLPHFLTAILQIQMNNYKYHYHFATFDIENYNLNNFKYNFVNMTAFRLVDSETVNVQSVLDHMRMFEPLGHSSLNTSNVIRHEPALLYDSVYAFAHGVNALLRSASFSPNNISCDQEVAWSEGSSLFNYINSADFNGLTGRVQFKEGQRNLLKLDLLKLRTEKLEKVGEWTSTDGLNISNHNAFHEFGTQNITLRVTTIETIPYVMIKNGNYSGNQRFEGFCIDLLDAIAINLGFQYELYFVPDGKFGAENTTTGEWNGLVREIIDKNADLAVAAMTINYARESVIDFTKPFMNLGIGILFKLPSTMPTKLFSFMSPLDVNIWLYVLAAYMLVSFTLFVVARFSPYEWHPMHPCVSKQQDMIENQFSLSNCFWFSTVTLMHQGCDLNPKATSTRIIGAIWWFFTLILVSSYTANLAAFLTVERMITPIESVEDLASQSKIQYGTLDSGSTMTFFRDSRIPTYQKMWRYMENRPNLFVTSYEEGKSRVLEGNFAFLMESTMLDYMVQRDCNLMQIGGLLDSKGYGIGAPKGSPWRDKISLMILDLQEKGVIQLLYNKWWKNPASCIREDKNKEGKANALGVDNIGGVFVVLLAGLVIAILVAFIEFLCNHKRSDYLQRQSLCSAMGEELRFAIKCRASKQRPRLRRNCSNCADEKEAFVGDTSGLSTLDAFNRKTRSCLNINQEPDAGVPTSLELLSSNSNLFHAATQVKQPHSMHTPSRRSDGAGLYHRNVSGNLAQFKENEIYPPFSMPKYYRYCSNKNQNQCAQNCTCEHYPLDHHS